MKTLKMKIIMHDPFAGYITVKIDKKQYNRRVRRSNNNIPYIIVNNNEIKLTRDQWPY